MGTLFVDPRVGSKELLAPLQKLGIDAQLAQPELNAGDFAFEGNGPDGPLQIGVERKAISDLVTSLRDGRLAGQSTESSESQLSRMRKIYDISWLLVEGEIATDRMGRLYGRIGRRRSAVPGGMSEDALTKQLLSLELQGGLRIARTGNRQQSASWLASLVRWWTDKQWNEHVTLSASYERHMVPVSLFCERAMKLPGVGLAVAKSLEAACRGSEHALWRMELSELASIPVSTRNGTKRLGLQKAEPILQTVRTLYEGY